MKKGFTIIELLVVVAIIGIISSIAVVLLDDSKENAENGAVRANMQSVQNQAALYYASNPTSGFGASLSDCISGVFADVTVQNALAETGNNLASPKNITCSTSSTGSSWSVELNQLHNVGVYCADSTGYFGPTLGVTDGKCNQS